MMMMMMIIVKEIFKQSKSLSKLEAVVSKVFSVDNSLKLLLSAAVAAAAVRHHLLFFDILHTSIMFYLSFVILNQQQSTQLSVWFRDNNAHKARQRITLNPNLTILREFYCCVYGLHELFFA